MERPVRARLTVSEGRRFGLPVGGALVLLGGVLAWRGHATAGWIVGGLGAVLTGAALMVPTRLGPIERAWMGFAHALSRVTTPVFMSLVYFLVILPVGILRRTIGRHPLKHVADEDGGYWFDRNGKGRSDLDRQF